MAYRAKTRNSREVRVITKNRGRPELFFFVLFLLAGCGFLFGGLARAEDRLSPKLFEMTEKCKASLNKHFDDFNKYKASNPADLDLATKCKANSDPTTQVRAAINMRSLSEPAAKNREKEFRNLLKGSYPDIDYANMGACENGYQAISFTLNAVREERALLCTELANELNKLNHCNENEGIKECNEKYREINSIVDKNSGQTKLVLERAKAYLDEVGKQSEKAKNAYVNDLSRFVDQRMSRVARSLEATTPVPADGGAQTKEEYLRKILPARLSSANLETIQQTTISVRALDSRKDLGEIVEEQRRISQISEEIKTKLDAYKQEQSQFAESMKKTIKEIKTSDTTDLTKYAGLAGPAMGAVGGLSGAGAAASSALPLAAAAAGGAATLASAGKSSVGGYDGISASPTTVAPSETGTSTTGSGPKAGGQVNAPGGLVPLTEIVTKTETKEEKGRAPTSDTFIPPSKLAASGSSTSMGKDAAATPAQMGATTAPAGSTDDLLHSFNDAIKPIPAPTKKKDDGLGDMGNIFGQVSKMFNFDTPAAGGEAPPPADMASSDSSSPSGEFNDGFQYGSGGGASASSGADETAVPGNLENASPEEREMMQFGSVGTPLFQRVHTRHRLCMEKGLLLQEFGRLPQ